MTAYILSLSLIYYILSPPLPLPLSLSLRTESPVDPGSGLLLYRVYVRLHLSALPPQALEEEPQQRLLPDVEEWTDPDPPSSSQSAAELRQLCE